MFTSLHTIARLGILSLTASSFAALTAAQLRPEPAPRSPEPNPWQAVASRDAGLELIHREDGRTREIATPRSERWEYVSTSPWACEDGSMEAVARFATVAEVLAVPREPVPIMPRPVAAGEDDIEWILVDAVTGEPL